MAKETIEIMFDQPEAERSRRAHLAAVKVINEIITEVKRLGIALSAEQWKTIPSAKMFTKEVRAYLLADIGATIKPIYAERLIDPELRAATKAREKYDEKVGYMLTNIHLRWLSFSDDACSLAEDFEERLHAAYATTTTNDEQVKLYHEAEKMIQKLVEFEARVFAATSRKAHALKEGDATRGLIVHHEGAFRVNPSVLVYVDGE